MEKTPHVEALKELGRTVILAIVAEVALAVNSGEIEPKRLGILVSLAVLRALEKWLHELGKTNKHIKGLPI